jgi:hypothetical protein
MGAGPRATNNSKQCNDNFFEFIVRRGDITARCEVLNCGVFVFLFVDTTSELSNKNSFAHKKQVYYYFEEK